QGSFNTIGPLEGGLSSCRGSVQQAAGGVAGTESGLSGGGLPAGVCLAAIAGRWDKTATIASSIMPNQRAVRGVPSRKRGPVTGMSQGPGGKRAALRAPRARVESELPAESDAPFPTVGIGASAGGLEAFTQLLKALPADTGMAFVLVQHQAPKHESLLSELLSRTTKMPVTQATDGVVVRPNSVYVIPPNVEMTIANRTLHIMPRGEARGPHLSIDTFFRSLAEDQQGDAIGIILSGSSSDGALGMAAIKGAGGITI